MMYTTPYRKSSHPCRFVDQLERRSLLSAALAGGTLLVDGTGDSDVIVLTLDQDSIVVQTNGASNSFSSADVERIEIRASGGNDSVSVDTNIHQNALILGEEGDDLLVGGGGDDTLIGGSGSDTLDGGGDWGEPAGSNTADFSDRVNDLAFKEGFVTDGEDIDTLLRNLQTLISGAGDDSIFAGGSAVGSVRYVDGGAGDDTIDLLGFSGDMTAHGGAGNDRILIVAPNLTGFYFGDAGNDLFTVQRSSATNRDFKGGAGIDVVDWRGFINEFWPVTVTLDNVANDGSPTEWESQTSRDNVRSDIERIIGTPGPDTLVGSAGSEAFVGNGGDDTIVGGAGNDRIYGGAGNDWINGAAGNDIIYGEAGNDRLFGGDGRDFIVGGTGVDVIRGGAGRDRIVAGSRRSNLKGNAGDIITLLA